MSTQTSRAHYHTRGKAPSWRVAIFAVALTAASVAADLDRDPAWTRAHERPPMNAAETRAFMKRLATYVFEHHLKRDDSPQRGMVYEYFWVKKAGAPEQWIEGEALDTMHDGAWFAAAMANAARATGDPFYREMLAQWQLPFYLRMLNYSDELFSSAQNDGRAEAREIWKGAKEWLLQDREKGFVPYWWDNGASVSLEMSGKKTSQLFFPGTDLRPQPATGAVLNGYSHGSSNHMAQTLAVMLEATWLLCKNSGAPADQKFAGEIAEAARHLQECRTRHGSSNIPAVVAAFALTNDDDDARKKLPEETWKSVSTARNDWRRAVHDFKTDEPVNVPGFCDDQEYRFCAALARDGTLTPPAAYRLIYDAFTLPMLYRIYSDDEPAPPGIGIFDLQPYKFINGKPADLRSARKGPSGRPRPIGSRFGPQNMVVTGWALQAMRANPALWEEGKAKLPAPDFFPPSSTTAEVRAALEKELGLGLRTWEAIFEKYGYIPSGIGAQSAVPGVPFDEFSDAGGYAHLISAGAQWLLYLEGKRDWDQPAARLR